MVTIATQTLDRLQTVTCHIISAVLIKRVHNIEANVNFFSTTTSTSMTQCALEATEFREIMQDKGHYALKVIQGHGFSYQPKADVRLPISD